MRIDMPSQKKNNNLGKVVKELFKHVCLNPLTQSFHTVSWSFYEKDIPKRITCSYCFKEIPKNRQIINN